MKISENTTYTPHSKPSSVTKSMLKIRNIPNQPQSTNHPMFEIYNIPSKGLVPRIYLRARWMKIWISRRCGIGSSKILMFKVHATALEYFLCGFTQSRRCGFPSDPEKFFLLHIAQGQTSACDRELNEEYQEQNDHILIIKLRKFYYLNLFIC